MLHPGWGRVSATHSVAQQPRPLYINCTSIHKDVTPRCALSPEGFFFARDYVVRSTKEAQGALGCLRGIYALQQVVSVKASLRLVIA